MAMELPSGTNRLMESDRENNLELGKFWLTSLGIKVDWAGFNLYDISLSQTG